ncbi:MAG: hypothetical protein LBS97_02630 [Treponema sp.]|jgi:hypothetical protein|nr:hypothetical protein [Treponema sp.]
MEKQSNHNGTLRHARLLTRPVLMLTLMLALTQTLPVYGQENERKLSVKPANQQFYVGRPMAYTLVIPDVRPAQVTPVLPTLSGQITLVSMRKEGRLELYGPVTYILFEFVTYIPGLIDIPALAVSIDKAPPFLVPFDRAAAIEDPMRARPLFMLRPDQDGPAEVGLPFYFTLYARNIAAVTGLTLDLRKDAIFSVAERFPALETGAGLKDSLVQEIPLARFEWLPLETGALPLPGVQAGVKSFAGASSTLTAPETIMAVQSQVETTAYQAVARFASMPYPAAFDDTAIPALLAQENPEEAVPATRQRAAGKTRRIYLCLASAAALALLIGAALKSRKNQAPPV